jgi:hypothetical protein
VGYIYSCKHCKASQPDPTARCTEAIAGGMAYVRRCRSCQKVLEIRGRDVADPPAVAQDCLSPVQIERLRFHAWRLAPEIALTIRHFPIVRYSARNDSRAPRE